MTGPDLSVMNGNTKDRYAAVLAKRLGMAGLSLRDPVESCRVSVVCT